MGMHSTETEIIYFNAFNGPSDSTGDDDFGYSVAWLDLDDFLEAPSPSDLPEGVSNDSNEITNWLKKHPDINGSRWLLVTLEASGDRYFRVFKTRDGMLREYRRIENEYLDWCRS